MTTFVFPGQGSQRMGMGRAIFNEYNELVKKADQILGYSIRELCMEDPHNHLAQTEYTQPALYVVNVISYLKEIKETGMVPDYLAGHSLGEYCALFAAGAFDFTTGLLLVKKRGELMSKATEGRMAAVIGLDEDEIQQVLNENNLRNVSIANYNSPHQFVIAGPKTDIEFAKEVFAEDGAKLYIPLNVSGAFHSPYMKAAKEDFKGFIDGFQFYDINIPVISNVNALPYENEDIKRNLVKQITGAVRWTDSIRYLLNKGEMEFKEIGPGNVLTNLIKKIQNEIENLKDDNRNKEKVYYNNGYGNGKNRNCLDDCSGINAKSLGSEDFKADYNIKYAYVSGAMYKGIASKELVVKMGKAGFLSYFGTGGLGIEKIETAIKYIKKELRNGHAFGMNLLCNPNNPKKEDDAIDLFLAYGIKNIEASAFIQVAKSLVRYRLNGLIRKDDGEIECSNRILVKLSRPEVARAFLGPAPEDIVERLLDVGVVTEEQVELSRKVPLIDDICVEADSGGHTDGGSALALMPVIISLRDEMMRVYDYQKKVRIGAAGGIGTPEAAAAAFILGADFILTGSINQCTVEAKTSDEVKDLLQDMGVQDTEYAPAGDMFEIGAKIQALKKGLFFTARANKLYDIYRQHNSLDEIDEKSKKLIQEKYFRCSFDEIYEEIKNYFTDRPSEIERAERIPKHKMALIFRWYFRYTTNLALQGSEEHKVDYQIHCGPALGAFNQWVKGTKLENWKNRHIDDIGLKIMHGAADILNKRFKEFNSRC